MLSLHFGIMFDALHDFTPLLSNNTQFALLRPAKSILQFCVHGAYSLVRSVDGKALGPGARDVDLISEVRDERDGDLAVARETM